jgi:hypothetical protein
LTPHQLIQLQCQHGVRLQLARIISSDSRSLRKRWIVKLI